MGVRDERCYTCGRANPGLWGFGPALRRLGADLGFVPIIIGICSTMYVLTLLVTGLRGELVPGGGMLSILPPSNPVLRMFGMSGTVPVFGYGWWWTLLTASWLHGSLLHILFNMMWVRDLGSASADVIGPSRTVIVYTVAGVSGFLLSSVAGLVMGSVPIWFLQPGYFTVGASASIFGLLGALLHYGRKSGSSHIHSQALYYAVFLGAFGFIPGTHVDNYAHFGGFVGGYLVAGILNPLARERGNHLIGAIVCIGASVAALAFHILYVLYLIRRTL